MKKNLIRLQLFSLILTLLHSNELYATCVGLGCTCTVGATPINFGTYNPFSQTQINSQGTVSVTCSALVLGGLVSYTIQLSTGSSNSYVQRTMKNGSFNLNYNLYTDAAYTLIWGNGSGGTQIVSNNFLLTPLTQPSNFTVYATIPILQNVKSGLYTDSITATVTF